MAYLLAVDGGGTKTEFALMEPDGKIVRRVAWDRRTTKHRGAGGPQRCATDFPKWRRKPGASCSGRAWVWPASTRPKTRRIYSAMVGDLFGGTAAKVRIENDCFIALHCGTLETAGIAIIAGTGSMAIGMNEAGERARSGGWGYRFGDEGSGYYIGYQALVRAVSQDGRAPETQLAALIEEKVGMPLFDLVVRYTAEDPGPDAVGSSAPLVTEAALAGNEVADPHRCRRELVLAARAVWNRLSFASRPVPIVLSGGAFQSDPLRAGAGGPFRAAGRRRVHSAGPAPVAAPASSLWSTRPCRNGRSESQPESLACVISPAGRAVVGRPCAFPRLPFARPFRAPLAQEGLDLIRHFPQGGLRPAFDCG